jgi:putative membrane protein
MPPDVVPGTWHLEVVAGAALAAGVYLAAVRRTVPAPTIVQRTAFLLGLAMLVATLNGPLHDLSERYLFSAHMVQHLALTLLVPPLLLLGVTAEMADPVLRAMGPGTTRVVRWLTRPLPALGLYTVALVIWHLPALYGRALEHHGLHILQHVSLLATATLAWWPVCSRSRLAPSVHYAAQILYLFAFGIPMTAVAAMIAGADDVLYPFYATAPRVWELSVHADQRLGGVLMWVPAGLVPLAAFTAVFFRWAASDADEDADDLEPSLHSELLSH